jgi:copper chaperone NosL
MQRRWLWVILAALLLLGCAQGSAEVSPPEIRYGEDSCAECSMIISDPRFAAAYAHEISPGRYQQLAFDDIGDMLIHVAKHPEHKIVAFYTHDYKTEEWLDAKGAYYVAGDAITTPMGHGIAAFTTEEDAQALALETNGEILTWEALQTHELDTSHTHSHQETMQQSSTK